MNFDDSIDINVVYSQLRKQYPKFEITKNENPAIRAMEKMQKAMAEKFESAGIYTEEDIIELCKEARHEIGREKRSETIM